MNKIMKSQALLGNRDLMRAMNRSTVLYIIKTYGPIARSEIARRCGLSPASVTGITAELIQEDIIYEKDTGKSLGGRRPILLAINPSGRYVVGIKLTETKAIGALTDLEATVIVKKTKKLRGNASEAVIKQLSQLATELMKAAGLPKKKLLGVGVGLAGIVNSDQGILRQSPFYGWKELPLRNMLQDLIHVPVYIDNDVNTLTLAEKWFGVGQGIDDFLVVTIGRGIGMGIVVNGQFYRGVKGGAGEFGHTVINPEGPICECGKRGCLETYVGDHGLLRMANEAITQGKILKPVKTIDDLLELAKKGDRGAQAIYENAGDMLGRGIANLINIFSPEIIIISGEGVIADDLIFIPMRNSIGRYVLPGLADDTSIQIDIWGDDEWARGAASLVLRELYESPIHRDRGEVDE
jgi:predicted NBD/HSP70 family sugar kinase